jgi:hypothetical protein
MSSAHLYGNFCITAFSPVDVFSHQSLVQCSFTQYCPCSNLIHLTSSNPKNIYPTSSEAVVFTSCIWSIVKHGIRWHGCKLILQSSSRTRCPLQNINFSNGNGSFPCNEFFFLLTQIKLLLSLDCECFPFPRIYGHPFFCMWSLLLIFKNNCCICFLVSLYDVFVLNVASVSELSFWFSLSFMFFVVMKKMSRP